MRGGVAVGDDLLIRQHEERLDSGLLQSHPFSNRAEIISQMQRPRRPLAGQHSKALWMLNNISCDLC